MSHRLSAGDEIDGFRLEERLKQGGMATIWRVTRPDLDLPMVMKVPIVEYGEGPGAIVGFEVEQMILPRLTGPHVPRFLAAGDFSRQPYIVMERIAGESLKECLPRLPLPIAEVASIGERVATALHDLHRQDVIHLDLKPSNVMLRENGEAVLIDFGLARHDRLPDLLAEEIHLPLGTGPYISPEQVLGNRTDPRSDLFALGVLLYFFTTGERPYGLPRRIPALRRRLWREPKPPRALRPDCPPWLQEVILRCLEVDPDQRHQSAAQLALDLKNPDQITLTDRAARLDRPWLGERFRRWVKAAGMVSTPRRSVAGHLASAPVLMVAVDLSPDSEALAERLRVTVRRILEIEPGARLACVNVLRMPRLGIDFGEDEQGRNRHVQNLVELRHWAEPLRLPEERVSFHVLEHTDPAEALLDHARYNHVDHIVMGARASSAVRRYLGSVSSQVVAEAPCSVTVVRVLDNDRMRASAGGESDRVRAELQGVRAGRGRSSHPDRASSA